MSTIVGMFFVIAAMIFPATSLALLVLSVPSLRSRWDKQRLDAKRWSIGSGAVMLVTGVFAFASFNSPDALTVQGKNPAGRASAEPDRRIEAYVSSKQFVADTLKAPSTARFCSYDEARVTRLSGERYRVVGWVDSQNSFGAMLRSDFSCTLELRDNGETWRAVDISVK